MNLEIARTEIGRLKEIERAITADLLMAMHAEQKDRAGAYKLSKVITLKVAEPEAALQWAATTNCLKVDTAKATQILRHTFDDPSKFGFERVESERIVPLKGKIEE